MKEIKLLGVHIPSDLKCNLNTHEMTKIACTRLWLIRRLKLLGANKEELLDVYVKQIGSVLECAAVVWHPGLTVTNTQNIERVQKACLAVILGRSYESYESALHDTGLERLTTRR